jgi:hypothetical protein
MFRCPGLTRILGACDLLWVGSVLCANRETSLQMPPREYSKLAGNRQVFPLQLGSAIVAPEIILPGRDAAVTEKQA